MPAVKKTCHSDQPNQSKHQEGTKRDEEHMRDVDAKR